MTFVIYTTIDGRTALWGTTRSTDTASQWLLRLAAMKMDRIVLAY